MAREESWLLDELGSRGISRREFLGFCELPRQNSMSDSILVRQSALEETCDDE